MKPEYIQNLESKEDIFSVMVGPTIKGEFLKYLSEKNLVLLDCQKNTSKQPYAVFFSKSNGDGIVIGVYKNKRSSEIPINPESVADFYRIYVCNFKS